MPNETHDASAASWVESANAPDTDFPIQNLPFATFSRPDSRDARVGVAIGDVVLDVEAVGAGGRTLNDLLARPAVERSHLRESLHRLLRVDAVAAERERAARFLTPMRDLQLQLPVAVGDYTDFFGSIFHATNTASMLRPNAPFFPNYRHMPLGYHGRASSIVVSGTEVFRPRGVFRRRDNGVVYALTRRLDYEAELGFVIGEGNAHGSTVAADRGWEHVAGVCLLNDWSARDIQAWESDPLGPFLAKSFMTTISPWIVTAEALEPFRAHAAPRSADDPPLLSHLVGQEGAATALAIEVEVRLQTVAMRDAGDDAVRVSCSNTRMLYWTAAQLVAHHTSNGCNLRTGDLLGSGTCSGPEKESWACLLERTHGGREPLLLPNGEARAFLEDGDEVVILGRCSAPGARSIGFGECRGRVVPAR
jgi:fumarylacetoacetase